MMLLLLQDAEQGGHHDLQQQLQRPGAPGAQGGDQVGVSVVRSGVDGYMEHLLCPGS